MKHNFGNKLIDDELLQRLFLEGVTKADLELWWLQSKSHRENVVSEDQKHVFNRVRHYENQGCTLEVAKKIVSKEMPIFGEVDKEFTFDGPLPYELKYHVDLFITLKISDGPQNLMTESSSYGSFNHYLRKNLFRSIEDEFEELASETTWDFNIESLSLGNPPDSASKFEDDNWNPPDVSESFKENQKQTVHIKDLENPLEYKNIPDLFPDNKTDDTDSSELSTHINSRATFVEEDPQHHNENSFVKKLLGKRDILIRSRTMPPDIDGEDQEPIEIKYDRIISELDELVDNNKFANTPIAEEGKPHSTRVINDPLVVVIKKGDKLQFHLCRIDDDTFSISKMVLTNNNRLFTKGRVEFDSSIARGLVSEKDTYNRIKEISEDNRLFLGNRFYKNKQFYVIAEERKVIDDYRVIFKKNVFIPKEVFEEIIEGLEELV